MCKSFSFISMLYIMLSVMSPQAFAISPEDLVKVTPSNDPKCVEYYTRNGELYCSTVAQSAEAIDPNIKDYEKLNIVFDDRTWKMAWGKKDETGSTVEYVPNGEDVENWHELITSQFFPGLQEKATLKEFADFLMQNLKDKGFDPIVTFIEDTDDQVILEFRIEQPKNQMQDELQMLTKDDKGIYILHYVIKEPDMGKTNRDIWVQNLKNSTIK